MTTERMGIAADFRTLFGVGTVTAMTDGQLLERFIAKRDEAAFMGIMARHGPMVAGVCRRVLRETHDVEDAFQATFLILACKAKSIREPRFLGTWLYGVAQRVATRARVTTNQRRSQERTALECVGAGPDVADIAERNELYAALDREIDRLPHKYRAAVVLCYLEGNTHEEAAGRLKWPLGTVKSRLAWARARLQSRLVRRGLAPSVALSSAALAPSPASASVSPVVLHTTARLAVSVSGKSVGAAAGALSATVSELIHGALRTMLISKFKLCSILVAATCLVAMSTALLLGQATSGGEKARPKSVPQAQDEPKPLANAGAKNTDPLRALVKRRIDAAKQRLDAQLADYEIGRITIDRYLAASLALMDAELDAAQTKDARSAAIWSHLERVRQVEVRERAELEVGRGRVSDLTEAQSSVADAEYLLEKESTLGSAEPNANPPAPAKQQPDRSS
ncbi:MAG TPA: RNA polymerase sigma factor [Isosphaeraceae bacterium]|nr:RNA polymerase sigma factor [Isosphaeraceae bacterium]